MPDRVEREIEEILSKLDDLPESKKAAAREPVSIQAHRKKRASTPRGPRFGSARDTAGKLNPAAFLLAGAGTVIGGLILSSVWAPLIWAAFGGVLMFLGGFVAALVRTPRPKQQAGGHFWRDRYINVEPTSPGMLNRLRRRLRR
jgi:hypothetical protein